jgi:hypothetical protein
MQDTTAVKHQDATAVKPPKNHFTPTSIGMPAGSAALVFLWTIYFFRVAFWDLNRQFFVFQCLKPFAAAEKNAAPSTSLR